MGPEGNWLEDNFSICEPVFNASLFNAKFGPGPIGVNIGNIKEYTTLAYIPVTQVIKQE